MNLKKFVNECREKGVLKNLSIYIVSSWVLLQVVALIAEPLGFSKAIVAYLLLALLIGFPLYIYSVWKFQLASNIEKKPLLDKTGAPVPGKFARSPFQKMYFYFLSVIGVVALGLTLIIIKRNFTKEPQLLDIKVGDKIAVLKFDNNTGDEKYDIAGKMAVDWIIHGITQNKVAQVISPEIIDDYSKILKASMVSTGENKVVTDYLKPSKIIEGEFFLNKDRLLFQCSVRDEIMDKTLISFKAVECDPSAPLDCIDKLKNLILGYLVTEDEKNLSLQDVPPSFEAYQYLIEAKNQRNNCNYDAYLNLLDNAIDADATFFEPKVYKFMYYYNTEQYLVADSLLRKLTTRPHSYDRQQILLNFYKGLLEGDYKTAYEYQQEEYNITPFHLDTNTSMMISALQLVNRPQAVDSIYQVIDMKGKVLQECLNNIERYKIKALADIELKNYTDAITLLKDFSKLRGYAMLKQVLLRAYIRSGNYEDAESLLSAIVLTNPKEWMDIYLFATKEFIIKENKLLANQYLDKIINRVASTGGAESLEKQKLLAECLFFREKYQQAEEVLEDLLEENSSLITQSALLAIVYQKNGEPSKAEEQIKRLEGLKSKYQYGSTSYALAQYYAASSDEKATMEYLTKSVAEGHWFETSSFQNDPFFKPYLQSDSFKRVLNFWH